MNLDNYFYFIIKMPIMHLLYATLVYKLFNKMPDFCKNYGA